MRMYNWEDTRDYYGPNWGKPAPRAWPADVAVPPRQVAGIRNAPEGVEEGALCVRPLRDGGYCLTRLELRRDDEIGGCSCFISAPCSSCMSQVPECPSCGHREPEPS